MTFDEMRERANNVRGIPLESVLLLTDARRDRYDQHRWHTQEATLSVTGMKFMDWKRGAGGGGAIDLVMHLQRTDFKTAVQWLSRHFQGLGHSEPARPSPTTQPCWPRKDDRKLPRVRRYLAQERSLPLSLLEQLIASGQLYADTRANAVFPLLGKEKLVVGAELRGTTSTPWRGMAPGSRKNEGYFSIAPAHPQGTVLCESAIDAISCHVLHPRLQCISTAGARPNPLWLEDLLTQDCDVYCGFDADLPGDNMAKSMIAIHSAVKRHRPAMNDWNDVLRSSA